MKLFIYRQGDKDIAIVTAEDLSEANKALKSKFKPKTTFFVEVKDSRQDNSKMDVYELSPVVDDNTW
jgi:hypothetical protein